MGSTKRADRDSDTVTVPSMDIVNEIDGDLGKLTLRVSILEHQLAEIAKLLGGERCAG